MSWFIKYRPRQIADLDLTQVRQQLLQLMESGTFPHSFLFAGPKGTGKTSASRIIGAMLNDRGNQEAVEHIFFAKDQKKSKLFEPDPDSDFSRRVFLGNSLVVQEMDAASNRGIDDIRQLKERVFIPPQEGSISVYILDEVHMLTNEAFNALLKILEEPPAHVVFILATTELHKVPATIISRCNLVSFYKASSTEITERLKKILKSEKISFEEDALVEIARRADGSFRDAVKLAEIASQLSKITLDEVDKLIGGSSIVEVRKLLKLVLQKDEKGVVSLFEDLRQRNFNEDYFLRSLFEYLHQDLLASLGAVDFKPQLEQKVSQFLLNQLATVDFQKSFPIAFLPLELLLLSIVQRAKGNNPGSSETGGNFAKKKASKTVETASSNQDKQELEKELQSEISDEILGLADDKVEVVEEAVVEEVVSDILSSDSLSNHLCKNWHDFLKLVENRNFTLAALLRSAQPQAGPNGVATIKVFYRFHQEQLEQPKLKQIIEECGQMIVGDKIAFKFTLSTPPVEAEVVDVPATTKSLESLAEEALM